MNSSGHDDLVDVDASAERVIHLPETTPAGLTAQPAAAVVGGGQRLLRRYRLDGLVGTGAFATVHAAHDEQLDDWVAIKVLAHNHALDPAIRQRFITEGQILRRLSSPHVVTVHDLADTDDGRPLLVLELCDRGTLRHRAQEARGGGWTPTDADAVAVATALAAAIEAIADAGVVHRDLTPANILLTSRHHKAATATPGATLIRADERLVVTDLGFCKDLSVGSGISASGGTEGFQPPEQRSPTGTVDVRSDLWAASAVLVWVLTGRTGLSGTAARDAMVEAGINPGVADGIASGLHEDADRRPATPASWLAGIVGPAVLPAVADPTRTVSEMVRGLSTRGAMGLAVVGVLVAMIMWAATRQPLTPEEEFLREMEQVFGDEPASVTQIDPPPAPRPQPAAPAPTPTPTPTPTPEVLPPEMDRRHQGEWAFRLVEREGWEWDVRVEADVAFAFGQVVRPSYSIGHATFTVSMHGGADVTITPVARDDARVAPPVIDLIAAHFPVFTDLQIITDPCYSFHEGRLEERRYGFNCELDATDAGLRTWPRWTEDREDVLDDYLPLINQQNPDHFQLRPFTYCMVQLHPNGAVNVTDDSWRCTVTGDTVTDTPPET
jgi:serine/threonine protein kinase